MSEVFGLPPFVYKPSGIAAYPLENSCACPSQFSKSRQLFLFRPSRSSLSNFERVAAFFQSGEASFLFHSSTIFRLRTPLFDLPAYTGYADMMVCSSLLVLGYRPPLIHAPKKATLHCDPKGSHAGISWMLHGGQKEGRLCAHEALVLEGTPRDGAG
ncbi:hypothetical protein BC826DRAFT_1053067 [Russula brevipes]|nr:hypothetical protein BC826DRAFT_1053067 [Russula brevipes]